MLFSAWNEARKSYVNFLKLSSMNKPGHQKILIQLTCFYGKMTVGNRKSRARFANFILKGVCVICYITLLTYRLTYLLLHIPLPG